MSYQKKRIAVVHDAFLYRGGGERLVTLMAKALDADLISGFFSKGSFTPSELGFTGRTIPLGKAFFTEHAGQEGNTLIKRILNKVFFTEGIRHLSLIWYFRYRTKMLSEYDIIIFSGNCLGALATLEARTKKNGKKMPKCLYYCHTPPRYLFDFREQYLQKMPFFLRPIAKVVFAFQTKKYIRTLDFLDVIFTNSKNTQDRILHFCKKEPTVLYPPVDSTRFHPLIEAAKKDDSAPSSLIPKNFSPYFFSFSRLSPPKRVDAILAAFLRMPDKNLVFTYGMNDPMKEELLEMCNNAPNIIAVAAPGETEFIQLLQGALASIYIPINEDFGMSPVESMSCGIPVLGVDEGGLRESIIDGKTGILAKKYQVSSDKKALEDELVDIISTTPFETWKKLGAASPIRANDFSLEYFITSLQKTLEKL